VKKTGFIVRDADEKQLVEAGEIIIKYIGRYPTSKADKDFVVASSINHDGAAAAFERLYGRLRRELTLAQATRPRRR
jgi:hypothetical protein